MSAHESLSRRSFGEVVSGGGNKSFIHPADEGSFVHAVSTKSASSHATLEVNLDSHAPQFTVKAFIAGLVSGTVCTFLALYYGLKTGITPSLNILGGVLGFGLTKLLMRCPGLRADFTPQENATIQTMSVAIYSLAFPAFGFTSGWLGLARETYELLGPGFDGNKVDDIVDVNFWRSAVWCYSLFSFGFFIAYPLRNYYVIKKRLLFPSGTATAYVISTLHASREQARRGLAVICKFFALAFCVNMLTWEFDGLASFPIFGLKAAQFGWALDWDLGSFGIGMLLSLQINASMLFGALIIYGGLLPWISEHRDGTAPGDWFDSATVPSPYLGLKAYALFCGLAVMIVQGIWSVTEIIVTVIVENARARKARKNGMLDVTDALLDEETKKRDQIFQEKGIPLWASALLYCITGAIACVALYFMLGTPWYQTLIAIIIVPVLACANIEGMGRTDWDVSSSYGKLIMFPIGWWNKNGSIIPAISVCHTTISGCSTSAALMQDFKTGYLLGASPSIMFYAQFIGSIIGCVICPALFVMLRSSWSIPTNDEHAFITGVYAPIFRTLAIVATGSGFDALPDMCLYMCLFFVCAALVLNTMLLLLDRYAPKVVKYVPEPSAISIGMIVGAGVPLEFFIGGLITWFWAKHQAQRCEELKNYIASGCIAGSGFAIILQVITSLCGLQSNISVSFTTAHTTESYMHAKEWVMAGLAMICVLATIYLGAWSWFAAPEVSAESTQLLDRNNYLSQSDIGAAPRSLSTSSEGYYEEEA